MSIYMKCQGIPGSATASKHQQWIQLLKMQIHMKTPVHTKIGDVTDRVKGRPVIGDIEIIKVADVSSVNLMEHMLKATVIPSVNIDVCHSGKELTPHEQYQLSNVIVSAYSEIQHPISGPPSEWLRLNFTKIEKTHTQFGSDGRAQAPNRTIFDLAKGQAC